MARSKDGLAPSPVPPMAAGHDPTDAQASLNYWYPRVADTFGRAGSEHFETYRRYGLREHPNELLLERWRADVGPLIAGFGLLPERSLEHA